MKLIYSILFSLCIHTLNAQGIFQLWGSTEVGGTDNSGVIFSTSSTGTNYQSRYQLVLKSEGKRPLYSEPAEYNGKLYIVTAQGGSNDKGTIYEFDPATNEYLKKVDFNGHNGSTPKGGLVLYANKFYGMTYSGGIRDSGTIFEYDPATNIIVKKLDLYNARGSYPTGNLTYANGKFYGMTTAGGTNAKGAIFEWDPVTNIFTKKFNLATATGAVGYGLLTWNVNKFYGMTYEGGLNNVGTIFEWDPASNIYTKKIDLSVTIGARPYGSMKLYNSKLYGMTSQGGASGIGVLFEYDPVGNVYSKKVDMTFTNGYSPYGSLVLEAGKFYGLAYVGGTNQAGTIFEWDPATTSYTKKQDLYSIFAANPYGSMTFLAGKFYGMTFSDVNNYGGVIFEWDPVANSCTKKIDFEIFSHERFPRGRFIEWGGKFFQMCGYNSNLIGGILEWDPATNTYTKRCDFKNATGFAPWGSLTALNGKLYGTTQLGGASGKGVIFEWDPVTYVYTKKIDFSDAIGSFPLGDLTYLNGKFYGMTATGGDYMTGVIFEWDPSTNVYTKKFDFIYTGGQWPNGNTPVANLTAYNGKLYGMTQYGGSIGGDGVIFEWDPITNIYTKKFDFSGNNGEEPLGSLVLRNGKFYGVTSAGGVNGVGVIFEWDPSTNTFIKKLDFGGSNGSYPQGNLTESTNGKFYGMTKTGGNNSFGLLFEWDPDANVFVKKKDFVMSDAYNPNTNYLNLFRAPVSRGTPGICTAMNSITIDNTNNNTWVAITDAAGDAVAEIKANGNNLGLVTTSLFVNNRPVREDVLNRLYLDRNLSITPQFQPSSPVDVRLYLKGSEFEALKNAFNSLGQPSGINSINDVGFFKSPGTCQTAIPNGALPVPVTAAAWNNDYVLTASISQFSSFYIANKTFISLPLTFLDFSGVISNEDALLSWKTANETNTFSFDVERSTNGRDFIKIGTIAATNLPGEHTYNFTDAGVFLTADKVVYYQVRQKEADGRFTNSKIISLKKKKELITVLPNPADDKITIDMGNDTRWIGQTVAVIDLQGRKVLSMSVTSTKTTIDISRLQAGVYFLEVKKDNGEAIKQRFIKL